MDKYMDEHLKAAVEATQPAAEVVASSETPTKKSGGGTASFIIGFVFGWLGVLVSFCWGGARAAFRGCLWRLVCVIIGALLLMMFSR